VTDAPGFDERAVWRWIGVSDELLDALQRNDLDDQVLGCLARGPTAEERSQFWARAHEFAAEVQRQVGSDYEVVCRDPPRL